jgi:hypothetical protein
LSFTKNEIIHLGEGTLANGEEAYDDSGAYDIAREDDRVHIVAYTDNGSLEIFIAPNLFASIRHIMDQVGQ